MATTAAPSAAPGSDRDIIIGKPKWRPLESELNLAMLLLLPTVTLLLMFIAYPFLRGIMLAVTNSKVGVAGEFVGFANFARLWKDPIFHAVVYNTFLYTFVTTVFKLLLGLWLALLLNRSYKTTTELRPRTLLAMTGAMLALAIVWAVFTGDFNVGASELTLLVLFVAAGLWTFGKGLTIRALTWLPIIAVAFFAFAYAMGGPQASVSGRPADWLLLGFVLVTFITMFVNNSALTRAFILLPFIVPTVLACFAWKWMFDPTFSVLNWMLFKVGLVASGQGFNWLGDGDLAMVSIIIVNVWRGVPFFAISLMAGLQTIAPDLHEAAAIDGAKPLQRFFYITWPLLLPVTMVVVLFSVIQTFADFQIVYVLTGGGPANATHLFATYAYQLGIGTGLLSQGAAVSLAMFPLLFGIVIFQLLYIRKVETR